ncbi:hypothetical protein [Streptomyces bottropensis]|uniref:hypothetical protein n=1 Tax=Streptomyces bottropensis TaxID=42235 RepID=UPI003677C4C2
MPARADLALGAGDPAVVEVDGDVVPFEAFALAALSSGVARRWAADGDPVFALNPFQVDQQGVAAVDPVLGRQQSATRQAGAALGQGLAAVGGSRRGGHVRDHVGALGGKAHVRGSPTYEDERFSHAVTRRFLVTPVASRVVPAAAEP